MAPPCGLTKSASSLTPNWRRQAMPCEAKASLTSIKSKSLIFVLVHANGSGLAAGHRHRGDLLGEIARRDGLSGALLRADRERVLIGARYLEFLGDVLAGLGHRIDAVLRLHQRIDEAPADGGVVNIGRARKRFRRLAHHERRPRHRFDPAGNGKIDLAGTDR